MKKYDTAYEAGYEALAAMIIKYAIYDYKKSQIKWQLGRSGKPSKVFQVRILP